MARHSLIRSGLALTVFVFVLIHVHAEDKCRTGCQRSGGHSHGGVKTAPFLKLQEGTTYKYNYDSKIEITLSSAEGQKTTTEVKAQVLVTPVKDCNQIIQLQNVQIIGSDGKKYTHIPDVDKPIRINYHDGHLEDSICKVAGDTQNSLNLKRAIASLLQVNQESGHEVDIFGQCPTEIQQHKEGNVIIVHKTRNLNRCAYRENIRQDFLTTTFNFNSQIRSSPLLNSDYSAKIRIKNGIIDQVNAVENYLYMPFSVGDNGAKAQVDTKLQYLGASKSGGKDTTTQPSSILFEDPHPVTSPTSNVNSILAAVKQAAKTIDVVVNENTAKEFINLVRILRVSSKDDLLAVYNQVRAGVGFANKTTAKKLFLDALLRAGNADTLEVAVELLKNKELNQLEQNLVFLSLPLVRHTSESAIAKISELLGNRDYPKRLYLDIGNLIGLHCRQHNCKNVAVVQKVTQKFLQIIGDGQPKDKHDETDIIYALKGLKNTGYLTDTIINKLIAIVQNNKLSYRLRVAALQTYLIEPCNDKLRDNALTILKNIQLDSELRINAYLVLTKCPNAKIGNAIKQLLETEPSYQVGGFIVSHIRQIKASANPDKELAKQHLGYLHLPKRFPLDPRKYSYSGEFSYTIDTLGVANVLETNLIYSQESFLPRSTSLNLTTEIFGHSVNLLEIETRQENFDRLLEHYFGRRGLLRSKDFQDLWNSKGKHLNDLLEDVKARVQKQIRSRRDLNKAEIDTITKQLERKTHDVDLDLDLSVKMFGTDVAFLNINDNTARYSPEALIDEIVDCINRGVDSIKNFEETLRANMLLLDADLSYPTSTGFPLRLGIEGAVNLQLKTAGSIDLRNLFKQDSNLLKLSLIPSASVEIASRLTLDALLVENGLKVVCSLYSSTGGDFELQLTNTDKIVDVKFALPLEKQDLLTLKHNIVFHTRELGAPEKNLPLKFTQNNDFSVCLDQLNQLIGLTVCVDINGPNIQGKNIPILPYPLAGDAKFSVYIEKDDISLYHYRHVLYNRNDKFGGELQLESLNKNKQKKVSLQLEGFMIPEKYFKVTLVSPIKTAVLEGKIITNEHEKSAFLRLTHDTNEYYGKIGVGITGPESRTVYKPILEYKTPQANGVQQSPYRVEGQVIAEHQGPHVKYILDNVKVLSPGNPDITVSGNLGNDKDGVYCNVKLNDGKNTGNLNGRLFYKDYLIKYNAEFTNTLNPEANFHLKGDWFNDNEEFKQSLELIHGHDLSSKEKRLKIENQLKHHNKGPTDYALETKNKLKYPFLHLLTAFDLTLKPKQFDYKVDVQFNVMYDIKVGSQLETEWNHKPDGLEYDVEFELWAMGSRLEAKSKRQVHGEQSKIENSFELNGKKVEISGTVKHHIRPQDVDVGSDLVVKIPQHGAPIKVTNGLKYNQNEFDGYHKVASGGTIYVDIFLKANRAGNANGAIKVNTPNIQINGQLKQTKGKGSGDLLIELPKVQQKLKIDTTFTVGETVCDVIVNIYPNDDKTKKITISTQNKLTLNNLDTKNQVDIFGNVLTINAKGSQHGEMWNGKWNGELEIELPTKHYMLGKFNRETTTNANHIITSDAILSVEFRENKNTPGKKIILKGQARNTNIKEGIYDVTYTLQAENGGKNLNGDLLIKRQKAGEAFQVDLKGKLSGSLFAEPLESHYSSKYQDYRINTYELRTSYGAQNVLTIKGNYNLVGNGQPFTEDFNIDLQTTSKQIRTLRLSTTGSLLKNDRVHAKGTIALYADGQNGPIIDYNGNGDLEIGAKDGRVKVNVKYGKHQPISIDAGYKHDLDNEDKRQVHADGVLKYGDKVLKLDTQLQGVSKNEYKLNGHLQTDKDKFGLESYVKLSEDQEHEQSEIVLIANNQKWVINSEIYLTQPTPSLDIKVKTPENKLIQLTSKITKSSPNQFGGELKIINQPYDFLFESQLDADINNVDDFHIKGNVNCPKLKLDKITFEAQNKQGVKTGRRIQIIVKSANKNLLQGSTNYQAREESGGKLIVEGSGSFKVKEQQQSANFKYIKRNLNQQQDSETGVEISFDASLGNRAIDAEFKLTNKQFRILQSYCEAKKECAYIEVDSKTHDDLNKFHQELEIGVDLRKLGLSHEFGLKAVTDRQNIHLQHSVDIHFQVNENNKYQYTHYLTPKSSGISLTTPRRILALENQVNVPQDWYKTGGRLSYETVLYMDKKNRPQEKSQLLGWINLTPQQRMEHELKFVHPALQRPLVISGNFEVFDNNKQHKYQLVLDVFAQPQQKLVVNGQYGLPQLSDKRLVYQEFVEIKSDGLQINVRGECNHELDGERKLLKSSTTLQYRVGSTNYNSALNIDLTPQQYEFFLKLNNIEVIKILEQYKIDKDLLKVDSEFSAIGIRPPLVAHLEIKNWNSLKFTVSRKPSPDEKLMITSALIPGQIADVRGEILIGNNQKHDLFHATVKLDEANFLKSDYGIQSKSIQDFILKPIKNDVNHQMEEFKKLLEKLGEERTKNIEELTALLQKATPNLQPLRNYYVDELKKIKDEIATDQTIKDISEFLHNLLAVLSDVFGESFNKFSEFIENVVKTLNDSFAHVLKAIDKDLLPKLQELGERLLHLLTNIVEKFTDIVLIYLAKLSEIAEKYQPELKQIATTLGEISQDLIHVVVKAYENIRTILIEQCKQIYNELRTQPLFEEVRAQYQQFIEHGLPPAEMLVNSLRDIQSTLKDIIPLEEFRQLIDIIGGYLEKKLQNQPTDDLNELERIVEATIRTIKKLIEIITKELATPDLQTQLNVPVKPVNFLNKLPRLVGVKFSPINYLLQEDFDAVADLVLSLVNRPRNLLPPFRLYGLVIQGQHIFTFDGKHMTFPGKCNYILAHDSVDGNFTIIGSYANGLLSAITLKQDNDMITLKSDGHVLLNNQPCELPARKPNIAAYRDYETVSLVGDAGVRIRCAEDLSVCSVLTSGFYHGKLNGLLGNGNHEPYDDLRLVNGKIVQSLSDFANNYRTDKKCGDVKVIEHALDHQKSPKCDQLFGWESDLRLCYPFVKTDNFKLACQHGVAQNVKDTELAVAIGYVAACNQHGIPIRMPAKFTKCTNADKPYDVGDKFSVKTPQKAVDVVLVVHTEKTSEPVYKEYIQPLVQQLTNELQGKGLTDIEFHLITYGGENQWPSHVTVGGKTTFKGKAPNLQFTEDPKEHVFVSGCAYVDGFFEVLRSIGHDIKITLAETLPGRAMKQAMEYPFRANALKTIVYVKDKPCEVGRFYPFNLLTSLLWRDKTVTINLITPFKHLTVKDTKHAKDIVGFNSDTVFTIGQTKKGKQNAELYKELDYDDWCTNSILRNNGNVFVTNNFLQAKGAAKKQFVQVTSHSIVEQLLHYEQHLDCACQYTSPFSAKNVCEVVDAVEKIQPKKGPSKS